MPTESLRTKTLVNLLSGHANKIPKLMRKKAAAVCKAMGV